MKELLSLLVRVSASLNELTPISHSEYQKLVFDIRKNTPYQEEVRREYLEKVRKYIEEIVFIRALKAIKGYKVPENSFDEELLLAIQNLLKIYVAVVSGKILLNNEGKTIVRIVKDAILNREIIGDEKVPAKLHAGDIVIISLEKAIPLYLLGLISFESNT